MPFRVVDHAFDRSAQQAADNVATERWAPSPACDIVWHITVSIAHKIRQLVAHWILFNVRRDIRFGQCATLSCEDGNSRYYSFCCSRDAWR